jgi:alginate O-acetyltransferase complex protein AlgJ
VKIRFLVAAVGIGIATLGPAADLPPGVVGKDGWLFYRHEMADASTAADARASVQLVARLARVLARRDVALVVTLVPIKARIYAHHLPAELKLTPYLAGQYRQLAQALRAQKVAFVDLDEAFLSSPKRDSDTPLFFRLDTHWSPAGALAAAQAIQAGIAADPALAPLLDQIPVQAYRLTWDEQALPSPANDLVGQLPKGARSFDAEPVAPFRVDRVDAPATGLLSEAAAPGVTLMGSSYSADWTLFPDALRYALQRDVLSVSVPANQGSWVGMETYLRDDAFQTRPPKLIVWELPERDMRAPPDFKYRESRYVIGRTEWLLRAAAWAARDCGPARAAVKSISTAGDSAELVFTRPLDSLEYLSARLTTHGSTRVTLEARGPGVSPRRFELAVPGDDAPHAFKTPLHSGGRGYDRVRLSAAGAHRFSLEDAQVCRHAEDLLK